MVTRKFIKWDWLMRKQRMNKVYIFIKAPIKLKLRLIGVLVLSAYYRYLIIHKDFLKISNKLGLYQVESKKEPNEAQLEELKIIALSIKMVCSHTWWKSECLVRAFIASYYLKRKGISGTVYMGVSRDNKGRMIAHAWTMCGQYSVTGGNGDNFTITGFWGIGL